MWRLLGLVAVVGCTHSASVQCLNDRVCPEGTQCDEIHVSCVDPSQLETCVSIDDGMPCTIAGVAPGVCDQQVCIPRGCNNGYREDPEECDGQQLEETNCRQLGYYDDKPLTCNSACSYDESQCTGYCGDGVVTPGHEICDGSPPKLSCVDLGYGAGFLDCSQCGPDQKDCVLFGWHVTQMPNVIADVHGTADDNVYALALGTDLLLRYDGVDWLPVDLTGCALPTGFQMNQLFVLGKDDVFISGSNSSVLHLTASGCERLIVDPNNNTLYLTDVWASGDSDVYVTDEYAPGGIYHYDGTSFTQVSSVPRGRIWGSSPSDVWAVSLQNGVGNILHFDGSAWSAPVTLPGINYATALWGSGPDDVYVGGRTTSNESGVAHYNGSGWTLMPTPNLAFSILEGSVYGGHPFIAGISGSGGGVVGWFDGATWNDMDADAAQGGAETLWISPAGKMYVAGLASSILTCDGTVRVEDTFGSASGNASVIVGTTTDRMFALVGSRVYEWDGSAWAFSANQPSLIMQSIALLPNGDLVASAGAGGIHVRAAAGTWTSYSAGPVGAAVWGSSPTDVWVSADGSGLMGVMRHWNGTSTDADCATCTSLRLFGLWGTSSNDVFGVGYNGTIRHFDGASWTDMASGSTEMLIDINGTSHNDIHAVGGKGTVLAYDGTTWSALPKPPGEPALQAVWGTANDLFVAGPVNYINHWDGTHWSAVDAHTTTAIGDITGVGQTVVYVDFVPLAHRILRPVSW